MGRTLKNTMLNVDTAEALDEAMYQVSNRHKNMIYFTKVNSLPECFGF